MTQSGIDFNDWRIGSQIGILSQGEKLIVSQEVNSTESTEEVVAATLNLAYDLKNNQSLRISYSDQKWFGEPKNTTLSQTIGVSYQKNWLR